jgi:hypothetical protein
MCHLRRVKYAQEAMVDIGVSPGADRLLRNCSVVFPNPVMAGVKLSS